MYGSGAFKRGAASLKKKATSLLRARAGERMNNPFETKVSRPDPE